MSSPSTTNITCPKCGQQQAFTMWESLNVTLDQEMKDQLLSGGLTRFNCTRCQSSCDVAYPMLYHDMDHRLMVYYTARTKDSKLAGLPLGVMLQSYQLRLVTERNELVEKIFLFDAALDDRTMELFKVSLRSQMDGAEGAELLFSCLSQSPDGQPLVNFTRLSEKGVQPVSVVRESYDEFADGVAELLQIEAVPAGQWLHVNRAYAEKVVRKYLPGNRE